MPSQTKSKELVKILEHMRNTMPMAKYLEIEQSVPEILGVTKAAWYYIKTGRAQLRIEYVYPLSKALGCKMEDLIPTEERQTA